jgi:hypothetical protein
MNIKSNLHAGEYCPGLWDQGTVEKSYGFYGQIRGSDGLLHFYNPAYTTFIPNQGLYAGQIVTYSPFVPPDPQAGKAACINALPPTPTATTP